MVTATKPFNTKLASICLTNPHHSLPPAVSMPASQNTYLFCGKAKPRTILQWHNMPSCEEMSKNPAALLEWKLSNWWGRLRVAINAKASEPPLAWTTTSCKYPPITFSSTPLLFNALPKSCLQHLLTTSCACGRALCGTSSTSSAS